MPTALKTRALRALQVAIAMTPWVISMFTLYWLEHGGIWTTETAHRGKISVSILLAGMVLSFLIQSRFVARRQN